MLYGLVMFVFQHASRREVNRNMTGAQLLENLQLFFPELEKLPHADTLFRLLCAIRVDDIEAAHVELIQRLIKKKKFRRYLINNCYPIAIDGTQKQAFPAYWCEQLLQRKAKKSAATDDTSAEPAYQYYIYVLEANLVFNNGMVIPLMSEFLDYRLGDAGRNKQDCEQRAFKRLAERLKHYFPRLPVLLLLDGLYSNGPVMATCRQYHWQFMIVLKDDSLPSVWEEFGSLLPLNPDNHHQQAWGARQQTFKWVNDIEYYYGNNQRDCMTLHVVVCEEAWEVVDDHARITPKRSRHAWISSRPLNASNLHERCNLGARQRWGIEACILVEKHQGYRYEHVFALDWNAMKGYHYLMRLAHVFNTLARFSKALGKHFKELGVRGFIAFVFSTLCHPWLDHEQVKRIMSRPFQLRLE